MLKRTLNSLYFIQIMENLYYFNNILRRFVQCFRPLSYSLFHNRKQIHNSPDETHKHAHTLFKNSDLPLVTRRNQTVTKLINAEG